MMKIAVVGLIGLVLGASSAVAEDYFQNGNGLYEACSRRDGFVVGYVMGAVDGIKLQQSAFDGKMALCIPAAVTAGQIQDVVCQFLGKTPAQRHHPAIYAVGSALMDSFPCKSGKN